jgi:cobalt-zinc-cadmium efflux system outer membrane protein
VETQAPDVALAKLSVREAEAQRVGAGVLFPSNPRLQADLRPPVTGGTLHDLGYSANLEMSFDVGGAPRARVREASQNVAVAGASLALTRFDVRAACWRAYVQARIAETRIEETKSLVAIGERILNASKQRAAVGAAGDIEELLATADLGQWKASIEAAQRQRDEHLAALRELLDLPHEQAVTLTTVLPEPPEPPAAEALVARALDTRPELAVVRARLSLLDARRARLERERFPKMGAYVGVDAAPVSPIFGVVGLSVELPVFQRNQGPRAAVDAAEATELLRKELQARQIAREVASLTSSYASKRRELATLTSTTLTASIQTLDLVERGWLAGRFDVFRVASAARDVARVRSAHLDALEATWLARIALQRATGGSSL